MLAALAYAGLAFATTSDELSSERCASTTAELPLAGKLALVFGGTSGIGLATSHLLAKEGARVVAISRNPYVHASRNPQVTDYANIQLAKCDVLDRDSVSKLIAQHAPIDILISAATGGTRAMGPFLSMDMDGYASSFDKLWGYANVVRFGAEHLANDGNIVLVSGAPARKAKKGQVALASVGAAVEQLARSVASEIAPKRINVVSPGIVETPMFGPSSDERTAQLERATATNLIDRPGEPEEVASAILFVVKNKFVTGTTVDVDGGWLQGPKWQ